MLPITEKGIELDVVASDAKEAVRLSGEALVREGKATLNYTERMVQAYETIGSYIVVAPGIAFPHARPDEDVVEAGVSFIRLKNPIVFGHDKHDPVTFVCGLCGVDKLGHITMLQQLSRAMGDANTVELLKQATSKLEILTLLQEGEEA